MNSPIPELTMIHSAHISIPNGEKIPVSKEVCCTTINSLNGKTKIQKKKKKTEKTLSFPASRSQL